MSGRCLKVVLNVSGRGLESVWRVPARILCLEGVWMVTGCCLVGVWMVSGGSLGGVLEVFGRTNVAWANVTLAVLYC